MAFAASTFTTTVTIAAPQRAVFAAFTDIPGSADAIEAITRIEPLTDGPVGTGTRWRETRRLFGREATEVLTIAAFDPPNHYTVTAENNGTRYETRFSFQTTETDEGAATIVTMTFNATPLTRTTRLLAFLMKPMMRRLAEHCAQDLADLKAAIEARHSKGDQGQG